MVIARRRTMIRRLATMIRHRPRPHHLHELHDLISIIYQYLCRLALHDSLHHVFISIFGTGPRQVVDTQDSSRHRSEYELGLFLDPPVRGTIPGVELRSVYCSGYLQQGRRRYYILEQQCISESDRKGTGRKS